MPVFSDPEGLAVTCWHRFIHLVENERRVPCSFMILSHLARFLSLLVCLTPRAWKNRKYGFMFSPSPFLRLFLCCSNTETPTHINICLCTKIFVCGRLHPPSPWPLPIKIKQQSLCVAVPVICEPLGYTVFPLWHLSAFWTVQSESAHQWRGQVSGQVPIAVWVRVKPRLHDEWPAKGRWQLKTRISDSRMLQNIRLATSWPRVG